MQSQDVAPRPASASAEPAVDVEQAEAALVEHYPRLVRLAYLVLPPSLGRNRRVVTAHALTQRALPRGRSTAPLIPAQSTGRDGDLGYTFVRLRVVRTALEAGLPLSLRTLSKRARLPALLPQVRGLRLLPLSGGADELALDQRLSTLSGAGRAAYVLRGLERLPDTEVCRVLSAAGVSDTAAALREADTVPARYALLASPEFDPCSLQARPTDLMRRRQHTRAAVGAAAALAVCGALVLLPGGGWGPDGAAAPSYAQNPSARAALDPARLTRVAPTAWEKSARADFSVWPARGELAKDTALLRRALAVWARPGADVRVSATPGTASGGPAGPPQLLYAGAVDSARVVLLYDGLRIVRYAEPAEGTRGAALDLARVDGADRAASGALVLGRADGNVRYLTAPWVKEAAERDLMKPSAAATAVPLAGGITAPVAASATGTGACTSWNVLQLTDASGTRVLTDLGELLPARLTTGRPGAVTDASGAGALRTWSPYACSLTAMRSAGVRSVNAWAFARQPLPDGSGSAQWVCTRSETWRGDGTRVLAQFLQPGGEYGAVTAKAEDVPACGERDPRALAGVLWKSAGGHWYLLAAGDPDVTSVTASGGITATARGNLLIAKAEQGARAELRGTSADGGSVDGLG
ncbi:hypothetical protein AB0465_20950 [Streptomyces griseoviridis]|uniref:DNA-directed RNA polymerase specialized sigma24 family protein n=1 Tax=Streptomyces hintoniae TaxID=3075521 RepID=A0ABU2UX42_9ACTN|nr:hypothetical protein [Streptomyces sp. DSM 41014]MDT0477594.1 hypothetical protein [Streptomyces sp. DSM 41014]